MIEIIAYNYIQIVTAGTFVTFRDGYDCKSILRPQTVFRFLALFSTITSNYVLNLKFRETSLVSQNEIKFKLFILYFENVAAVI